MASKSHHPLPQLVQSGDYSDFTLTCEGQEFKLHRLIVCPKAPVIARALEGNFQEATSKVIRVEQFDVSTVRRLIVFLYTGDYKCDPPCTEPETPSGQSKPTSLDLSKPDEDNTAIEILCHVRMNSIGDYYDIQGLMQCANDKIKPLLEKSQTEFLPRLIQEVSESTGDTALQSIVVSSVASRIEDVIEVPAFSQMDPSSSIMIAIINACGLRVRWLEALIGRDNRCSARRAIGPTRLTTNPDGSLRKPEKCRHCNTQFDCFIEAKDFINESSWILRCGNCFCRHY